jgi:hypothetical protein
VGKGRGKIGLENYIFSNQQMLLLRRTWIQRKQCHVLGNVVHWGRGRRLPKKPLGFFLFIVKRVGAGRGGYPCKKKIVHPQPALPRKKTLNSNPQPTKITKKSAGSARVGAGLRVLRILAQPYIWVTCPFHP